MNELEKLKKLSDIGYACDCLIASEKIIMNIEGDDKSAILNSCSQVVVLTTGKYLELRNDLNLKCLYLSKYMSIKEMISTIIENHYGLEKSNNFVSDNSKKAKVINMLTPSEVGKCVTLSFLFSKELVQAGKKVLLLQLEDFPSNKCLKNEENYASNRQIANGESEIGEGKTSNELELLLDIKSGSNYEDLSYSIVQAVKMYEEIGVECICISELVGESSKLTYDEVYSLILGCVMINQYEYIIVNGADIKLEVSIKIIETSYKTFMVVGDGEIEKVRADNYFKYCKKELGEDVTGEKILICSDISKSAIKELVRDYA